jgi:hypothetical protein
VSSISAQGTCPQVSSIPVQPNFDFDKFADGGVKWNMVLYNQMVPIEGVNASLQESNVFFRFSRNRQTGTPGGRTGKFPGYFVLFLTTLLTGIRMLAMKR